MRKLKLQMQMTLDGHVAGPEGELDWMADISSDAKLLAFINQLADTSDTILLGRKMTPGFVHYWEHVPEGSPEYSFAQKMVRTPKVVFSKTVERMSGENLRVENGDLAERVNALKAQHGADLLVYGGAGFVSSLIGAGLIDELHLFVNPTALGKGLRVFSQRTPMRLDSATRYPSGVVVMSYTPR